MGLKVFVTVGKPCRPVARAVNIPPAVIAHWAILIAGSVSGIRISPHAFVTDRANCIGSEDTVAGQPLGCLETSECRVGPRAKHAGPGVYLSTRHISKPDQVVLQTSDGRTVCVPLD